jgi:hypothetical protein
MSPALAAEGIKAAASIINNTVTNLFNEKVRRGQVTLLQAKADREKFKNRLDQLNSQQQLELAMRLQNSQDENAKFEIIQDTVSKIATEGIRSGGDIYEAAVNAQSKNAQTTAIIIGASLIALIGAAYFLTKKD